MMLGGGIDVKDSHRVGFRIAQVDWVRLPAQFSDETESGNLRFSMGLYGAYIPFLRPLLAPLTKN